MLSQPRSRSTANSRNSFVYRLFATRSFLSCKCAISVCLKIGVQSKVGSGYKQPDFCRHSFVYADGNHLHRLTGFQTKVAETVPYEVSPDRSLRTMLKGRKMIKKRHS